MGAGLEVYMAYLLRYVKYPVTVSDLKKTAETKQFHRLVYYLDELPQDTVYSNAREALEHFERVNQQSL